MVIRRQREKRSVKLQVYVTERQAAYIARAADRTGLTLSHWLHRAARGCGEHAGRRGGARMTAKDEGRRVDAACDERLPVPEAVRTWRPAQPEPEPVRRLNLDAQIWARDAVRRASEGE